MIDTWTTPNSRRGKAIQLEGQDHEVITRQSFCARTGSPPLDMIDLRSPEGRILGRTHVIHQRDTDKSVIEELFVAPTFRRQGYGRVLLDLAVERITSWHKKRAELLLHEADASPNGEVRAMNFGLACNFTWEGRYFRRPNVIDTAYREVAT